MAGRSSHPRRGQRLASAGGAAVSKAIPLVVDFSRVTEVDSSALSLMLEWCRPCRRQQPAHCVCQSRRQPERPGRIVRGCRSDSCRGALIPLLVCARRGVHSLIPAIEIRGVSKAYGKRGGAFGRQSGNSAGRVFRAAWSQRCGQDHADQHARGTCPRRQRRAQGDGSRCGGRLPRRPAFARSCAAGTGVRPFFHGAGNLAIPIGLLSDCARTTPGSTKSWPDWT